MTMHNAAAVLFLLIAFTLVHMSAGARLYADSTTSGTAPKHDGRTEHHSMDTHKLGAAEKRRQEALMNPEEKPADAWYTVTGQFIGGYIPGPIAVAGRFLTGLLGLLADAVFATGRFLAVLLDTNYLRALWADVTRGSLIGYGVQLAMLAGLGLLVKSIYATTMGSLVGVPPRM
jgi:hypothetical protein